jgi:uncharacterized protein (TIGR02118 family)
LIKVSILYPNQPGSHFDADYYLTSHMPLAVRLLAPVLKGASVDVGLSGMSPDQPPPFAAICELTCDSAQAFGEAFAPHQAELMQDIPNYTDVQPLIQFSEIRDIALSK